MNHHVAYQVKPGTTTYYAFNLAGQRIGTYDSTLTQQLEEVYWGSEPVAFLNSSNQMNFHFQDYIGSARLDDLGAGMPGTLYSSGWRPFGDDFAAIVGPDQDAYHFAGLDADPDGTDHTQFRNYQPVTAQWLSPDPYMGSYSANNPQSFNRYAYVLNNPLFYTDSTGLYFDCGGGALPAGENDALSAITGFFGCLVDFFAGGDSDGNAEDGGAFGSENSAFGGGFSAGGLESGGGSAPNNGRNCSAGPASAAQYAAATAQVAALTAQFASGLGPTNQTFGPGTSTSAVMGQSAGVTEVLGVYMFTGKTNGLYTFGASGAYVAGGNPVAQFIGSFRWRISGGVLSVTNTTSLRSLTYDHGPQYRRRSFPTPGGNIHQTIQIGVVCH